MKKSKGGINWNNSKFFDFAMEILILIVIFIMPTIFDRRLGIVFSGTKAAWMRVLGSVILGIWAIKLIITGKHRFLRSPLDWPVVSFLLCTTIATLTSVHVYTSLVGFYGRYEGLSSWYLFGLFFFAVTNYIKSFDQLKRIIVTVISASTLMAVYSVVQRYELDPYMWGGVVTWQRVIGTIGQPNFLAAYMLMAFFLILSLFMMKEPGSSKSTSWQEQLIPLGCFLFVQAAFLIMIYSLEAYDVLLWYSGFSVITAAALLFAFSYERLHPLVFNFLAGFSLILIYISILYTQSRGGYLGFFAGAVLFTAAAGRKWIFANWRKIAILGFLIVLFSGITMTRPEYSPFQRFASEITTVKEVEAEGEERRLELRGAAGSRGETWKSAFHIIIDYPIFGIGPEVLKMVFPRYETELFRFKEAFHVKQDRCHNETFDVSVTKGLATFFVYLWLLFTVFRVGWGKLKTVSDHERLLLAGMLAAVLSFLVQNQFSFGVVAITSLFWMIWGMIMVVGRGEDRGEGERKGEKGREFSWMEIPWLAVAGAVAVIAFFIYISFFSFRGDIWFKSGKTKMQMNRVPEAVEDFERSLEVFPFEGGTVSHLGIAYLNLSRMAPEKNRYLYLNKAISTLRYGTWIDPYNADNFYILSKIYSGLSDPEALSTARKYAEDAIKIDPYYAEVYHVLGLIYERQGNFREAADLYEKAFFINPNLAEPMASLENLFRKLGRLSEALRVFEKALDRYGDDLVILEKVGKLSLETGRTDRALQISERMIELDPELPAGHLLRAEVYLKKGNRARAREEFEQVFMLDPKNDFAREMLEKLK